ncbi:MAG TPA: LPS export ABC transporter periplasmic protein LptC [Acidobacteriota bacterium]|nr:LPS export ABC transporter periplasmic protein LptC [Acidobacteriota bacterium]
MQTTRWIRLGLAVVFLAGLAAIIFSLTSRQPGTPEAVEEPLLDPDVESQSTRFEYSEKEEGRTVFRVQALQSIQRSDGRHELEEVLLELYNPQGEVADTIRGRKALYRVGESRVEFSQDVEIRLVDGTVIRSQQVRADLERELILIDQQFSFSRQRASGEGRRLLYRIQPQVAEIEDFKVRMPSRELPLDVASAQAVYDLGRHHVELTGDSSITRRPTLLTADRIEVWMDSTQRLERILSQGSARFAPQLGQSFAGQVIDMAFQPASGRLLRLEVRAASPSAGRPAQRAVYQEETPQGQQHLESDLIVGRPTPARGQGADLWLLRQLEARGDTLFRSPPLRIREAQSQVFLLQFAPGGRSMRTVTLQDQVSVLRRQGQGHEQSLEELYSSRIDLRLNEEEQLEEARVAGPARLEVNRSGTFRRLTAQDGLVAEFDQGQIKSLQAGGGCRLDSRQGREESSIQAPQIRFRFEDGKPFSAWAGEGVIVDMGQRQTRSRTLSLHYRGGLLAKAVQTGLFSLSDPAAGIELMSEEAVYHPIANQVRAASSPQRRRLVYRNSDQAEPVTTTADEFLLDRADGGITALGDVRTDLRSGEEPWMLQAGRMRIDQASEVVEYSLSPKLERSGNLFQARRILLSSADRSLRLQDEVFSRFQAQGPAGASADEAGRQTYQVRSQTLRLDPDGGRAEYRGEVFLKSRQLEIDAPNMDIVESQGPPSQASLGGNGSAADSAPQTSRRIEAWDQVEIRLADGRRALGGRLVYDPTADQGRLTGDPVRLYQPDPKSGKTRKLEGAVLVFQVENDSFQMQGVQ